MSQSLTFDKVLAVALIRWQARLGRAVWRIPPEKANAIADELRRELQSVFPAQSTTDLAYGLQEFLLRADNVAAWYRTLVTGRSEIVTWRNRQPLIGIDHIQNWLKIQNHLDEDGLLAFHYAESFPHQEREQIVRGISGWRTICRSGDASLNQMWNRGLSDLHVHVGGTRAPDAIWLELVVSPQSFRRYPNVAREYEKLGLGGGRANAFEGERVLLQRMTRANAARKRLLLELYGDKNAASLYAGRVWQYQNLLPERVMLIEAWMKALANPAGPVTAYLDKYLFERNVFFSLARQPSFVPQSGLRVFSKQYFPYLKPAGRNVTGGSNAWRMRPNARRRMRAETDALSLLSESSNLQRLELRIAPFDRARDYWWYFKNWSRLVDRLRPEFAALGRDLPDVTFAVHFKRTRSAKSNWGLEAEGGWGDVKDRHALANMKALDRQSAALKAALSCPGRSHHLAPLTRIDAAGEERDAPASAFGLHFRLLRGDPDALRLLKNEAETCWAENHKALGNWKRLAEQGRHVRDVDQKWLGITMHAGEDYADVLDGLYQMHSAIEACGMEAGDSIGHGLALVDTREAPKDGTVFIEAGASWDSLCWLYDEVFRDDAFDVSDADLRTERRILVDEIVALGRLIHESIEGVRHLSPEEFVDLWRHLFRPRDDSYIPGRLNDVQAAIVSKVHDDAILRARERPQSLGSRLKLKKSVQVAQASLKERITKKRIVIELNPTSNLRITGIARSGDLLTVKLLQAVESGLLACINTDDPGVFGSCIENEYAVLLNASRDPRTGLSEGQIHNLLEVVRQTGIDR
jgi:hypothetical protein